MSASIVTKTIALDAAMNAVKAAIEKAQELGISISVSVVDSSAIEMAFVRMNNSFIPSMGVAKDKAYTAAGFGFPTMQWKEVLEGNVQLQAGIVCRPNVVTFGGGLPIMEADELIGAIGVSGGTEEQDIICAQAGIDSIS